MSKATRDRAAARKAAAETPDKAPAKPVEPAAAPAPEPIASDIAPGLPGGPALPETKPVRKLGVSGALASASRPPPGPPDPLRVAPVRELAIGSRFMVAWVKLEPDGEPVRVLRFSRGTEILDFMVVDRMCDQLIDALTQYRQRPATPTAAA